MSSPARVETQTPPVASGNLFLALVGLGTLFMLFLAMIPAMKAGPLFTEENLLYVALIFAAAATALYVGFAVSGTSRYVHAAWVATWISFLATTGAAAHRWYMAGHPPFASVYEMLLSFVWALGLTTLFVQKRYGVKVIGTITMPVVVVGIILMQLMPSAVRPLVPALQSTWLHIHVALAMLAYAAAAASFGLAMMFLIQDKMRTETFLANTSGFLLVVYATILGRFSAGGLKVIALDAEGGGDLMVQRGVPFFVVIPELGWVFAIIALAVAAPLALYLWAWFTGSERGYEWANRAFFFAMAMQVLGTAAFVLRARGGAYLPAPGMPAEGLFPVALSTSPFLLAGMISGLLASLLYLMMVWRRDGLQRMLPSADRLDSLTYKAIGLCFPLMTLMIAAGAYWANRTWGSYWSWDPKETAALITWIVYAGYLHMRIARGWRGRRAAYFAILGFAVTLFTFFGVTYLLPGLHAYA